MSNEDKPSVFAQLSRLFEEAKDDKVFCAEYGVDEMEYPITVDQLDVGSVQVEECFSCKPGDLIAIRPCGEGYEKKTFLGIMIGDLPIGTIVSYRPSTKTLEIIPKTNPAILIPQLGKIVYGYESWWVKIKNEEDLKQITDEDIKNIWYVKALQQLMAEDNETTGDSASSAPAADGE